MKVAAFQFHASKSIKSNLEAIKRGVEKASSQNIRFLITQECALCGYPPVEIDSVSTIDFELLENAIAEIRCLSEKYDMYIGAGTLKKIDENYYNAIEILSPDKKPLLPYYERALWGWDLENFSPGNYPGIYCIDGIHFGIRICYEVRFPEYFRELFKNEVTIILVSFCDLADEENINRYEIIKGHLITRAVENTAYVVSVNGMAKFQTAPTAIIDPDGNVLGIAPQNEEALVCFEYYGINKNFGITGRMKTSKEILGRSSESCKNEGE